MTRRCRWLLVLGCWSLSALVAPDSYESIGTAIPSTVYASPRTASIGPPPHRIALPDLRIAGKPRASGGPEEPAGR